MRASWHPEPWHPDQYDQPAHAPVPRPPASDRWAPSLSEVSDDTRSDRSKLLAGLLVLATLAVVTLLLLVGRLTADDADGAAEDAGDVQATRVLETVTAELAADGRTERAERHTRTEVGIDREAEETTTDVPAEALPIAASLRYVADGRALAPDELPDHTGEVVVGVELRNTSAASRTISYGTVDGTVEEDVDVAIPLAVDVVVELDGDWTGASTEVGTVTARPDGGTHVRWQAALFEPFGSRVTRFELRATAAAADPPRLRIEAWPITTASAPLLAATDDLLVERATTDAVAAAVASVLQDAVAASAEGADELGGGIEELGAGLAGALDELDELDPDALLEQALQGLAAQLDVDTVLDDLLADLIDLPETEQLLADLDPAALLADAGLDDVLEELLAAALPGPEVLAGLDPEDLGLDPAALIEQLDLGALLGETLAELDLGALLADQLADLELAALLEEALADVDTAELLAEVLADLDPAALLEQLDDEVLERLLAELAADLAEQLPGLLDPERLREALLEQLGDRTLGELIADADLTMLVALLLGTDDLEFEVAALLAVLLDELEVELPTVGAPELERFVRAIGTKLVLVDGLIAKLEALAAAVDEFDETLPRGVVDTDQRAELAALAEGLADRLRDASDAPVLDLTPFDRLDASIAAADERLDAATTAVTEAEDTLGPDAAPALVPIRDAVVAAGDALTGATEHAAAAREASRAAVADLTGELAELAAALEAAALELAATPPAAGTGATDPAGTGAPAPLDLQDLLDELLAGLLELRAGLAELAATITELAEELEDDIDLGELLQRALDEATIDLAPVVRSLQERAAERLADVRLEDLPLEELLAEIDLDLDLAELVTELLAELELPDLAELLEDIELDLTELIAALDLDLAELLVPLVDELPDLTELLADLDPAPLLDAIEEAVGPELLAELVEGVLPDPAELAALLAAAFEELDPPELTELLEDLDLDLAALLAAAGLTPEELFDAPDLDPAALLDALDLDPEVLAPQLGLDTLAELDAVAEGVLEGVAGLAAGAEALTDGLEALADEGLENLVAWLDEDNREVQRDLALLRELGDRARTAGTAPSPDDVAGSVRYELVSADRTAWPRWPLLLVAVAAVVAVTLALRSRGSA